MTRVITGALTLCAVATGAAAQSPETLLFRRLAPSIVRVEAGLGQGSGFLVDPRGLIATNAHVIASADTVTVYLDSLRRVLARVLARDEAQDLAVLQVPEGSCGACTPLVLADQDGSVPEVGTPLLALGYPLGQPVTMTRGMVTTMRRSALLTDAVINPGNSGGPLVLATGEVVAIATFRDVDENRVGAGLGGGILASALRPLLQTATGSMAAWRDTTRLDVMPLDDYPLSALKPIADTISTEYYDKLAGVDVGPFTVNITTPLGGVVRQTLLGRLVSRDRRKREDAADLPASSRYNALAAMRDWQAYIGDDTRPVVSIAVQPNVGETFGSLLGRAFSAALTGSAGTATLKFRGDVRGLILRRNGTIVPPLRGGHMPVRAYVEDAWISLSDVADRGFYVYSPEAFRPNPDGTVPTLELEVRDLKAPLKQRKTKLDAFVVARVWNDFGGFYRQQGRAFMPFAIKHVCTVQGAGAGGMSSGQKVCEDQVGPAK